MTGEQFAELAESRCGEGPSKSRSMFNLGSNSYWSAAFVSSCAKQANVLNVCIPKTNKCQDVADIGVKCGYGTWIDGPSIGSDVTPKPGDVVLVSWSSSSSNRADCVGIVRSVEGNAVNVVRGDCGSYGSNNSKVRIVSYDKSLSCIKGYFRPNWNEVLDA